MESETQFRKALMEAPLPIMIHAEDGEVILVNRCWTEISGYVSHEIPNVSDWLNNVYETNVEEIYDYVKRLFSSTERTRDGEYRIKTKSGETRIWDFSSSPIGRLPDGRRLVISVATDITERKMVEEDLRNSEERWHLVLCGNNDGIWEWNVKTNELFFSSRLWEMLGYTEDEFGNDAGKWKDIIHPDDSEYLRKEIMGYISRETDHFETEKRIKRRDGSYIWTLIRGQALWENGGKASRMVGSISDITRLKFAEEAQKQIAEQNANYLKEVLELDKFKTDFFANLSHELKTPITVMLSTLQLTDFYLKGDIKEFVAGKIKKHQLILRQNCYRLQRLVNNLIDITKIDSGYLEIGFKNLNIVSLVEEIVLSVREYMENSGISVLFDTDMEEKIIAVDPDKIERIILNLISNAVKFTSPGGNISVNIYDRESEVLIAVKDTGCGIPADKLNLIFERFRQVDGSLARNHEGSGIGLSLVKSLVELHGGKIDVKSECGRGSEFIIRIPVRLAEEDAAAKCKYNNDSFIQKINIEFSDIYTKV